MFLAIAPVVDGLFLTTASLPPPPPTPRIPTPRPSPPSPPSQPPPSGSPALSCRRRRVTGVDEPEEVIGLRSKKTEPPALPVIGLVVFLVSSLAGEAVLASAVRGRPAPQLLLLSLPPLNPGDERSSPRPLWALARPEVTGETSLHAFLAGFGQTKRGPGTPEDLSEASTVACMLPKPLVGMGFENSTFKATDDFLEYASSAMMLEAGSVGCTTSSMLLELMAGFAVQARPRGGHCYVFNRRPAESGRPTYVYYNDTSILAAHRCFTECVVHSVHSVQCTTNMTLTTMFTDCYLTLRT